MILLPATVFIFVILVNAISYDCQKNKIILFCCRKCFYYGLFTVCPRCRGRWFAAEVILANLVFGVSIVIFFMLHDNISIRLIYAMLAAIFAIIAIIDCYHLIIPDIMQILLFFLLSFCCYIHGKPLTECLVSALLYFGVGCILYFSFLMIKKKEGIGFGDIKLIGCLGLALKPINIPIFFLFAGLFGLLFAVLWKFLYKFKAFPFAPSLILSFLVCNLIVKFYVNLLDYAY